MVPYHTHVKSFTLFRDVFQAQSPLDEKMDS